MNRASGGGTRSSTDLCRLHKVRAYHHGWWPDGTLWVTSICQKPAMTGFRHRPGLLRERSSRSGCRNAFESVSRRLRGWSNLRHPARPSPASPRISIRLAGSGHGSPTGLTPESWTDRAWRTTSASGTVRGPGGRRCRIGHVVRSGGFGAQLSGCGRPRSYALTSRRGTRCAEPSMVIGTRPGRVAFHCARRWRVLPRESFRFGTATASLSPPLLPHRRPALSAEPRTTRLRAARWLPHVDCRTWTAVRGPPRGGGQDQATWKRFPPSLPWDTVWSTARHSGEVRLALLSHE